MKKLVYNILQREDEDGVALSEVNLQWSEANEEIAKAEAYNGEYEIIDDGQPDPEETPSQMDVIEAQVTYTAMMTDTLLEV